jgi:hypothetical protein
VERSLRQPVVGGEVRFSRGAVSLFPQAAPAPAPAEAAAERPPAAAERPQPASGLVSKAFTALTSGRTGGLERSLRRLELQVPL